MTKVAFIVTTTGSREWPVAKVDVIHDALEVCLVKAKRRGGLLLVRVGDARGADRYVMDWAMTRFRASQRGLPSGVARPERYEARWHDDCVPGRCRPGHRREGERGDVCPLQGYVRNEEMVRAEPVADLFLAFIRGESRGSTHCLSEALAFGLDVLEPFRC